LESLIKSQNFSPDWPELGLIRAEYCLNREKPGLKSREWYYIVSTYNYYKLTLFLMLIEKFDK